MLTQLWWLDLTLQQLPLISRTTLAPRFKDAVVIFLRLFSVFVHGLGWCGPFFAFLSDGW